MDLLNEIGKVGFSLEKYFYVNNVKLNRCYSKSYNSAEHAAEFTNSKAYDKLQNIVIESDALFITTPDDEIKKIWQSIKNVKINDKLIIHTSGSLSSNIFSDIKNKGAFGYSIHPMFPFSDKYNTYRQLNSAYFSIEGDKEYLQTLKTFIEKLANTAFIIDADKKSLYHLEVIPKKHCELYKELSRQLLYLALEKNKEKDYGRVINFLGGRNDEKYS